MGSKLSISEIFYSIQGESCYAGFPCIFIRLSGCNLRCNYCDADYTWDEGDSQEIGTVLSTVDDYPCRLVEVTGGEPLFQETSIQLLTELTARELTVLLETNGSIPIDRVPAGVTVILDVKCPDSGSKDSFHPGNIRFVKQRLKREANSCEMKFVLSSKDDYCWAKDFISHHELIDTLPILFSPVQKRISPSDLAEWLMEDGLNVRLQLQLHAILWPDISRGV
ncbi:MAG: radical SAM protein [Desulfocapsa sp.]|nr:radical SAM protein [Desulfocapsa sp.]